MDYYVTKTNLAQKTNQWLNRIAPFNTHKLALNPSKSALLVIDMQKFFLDPESPTFTCGGLAIIDNLKSLIDAYRRKGLPVIFTCHVHDPKGIDSGIMKWWWEGMCIENSPESKVIDEIAPREEEKIIYKHRYSAFYNTDLETYLRGLKVEDLVVTGIMTNMCCESTARDAYYRDYRVFFLADATGSINEEMHIASLLNLALGFAYVTHTQEILNFLET
ncbi:cysteine hydrolase [Bacteroidetes/Chlorobi group bacterium MS-B_bin-24]|nr:MAG: cysteine hydrolase [Bacteroidetes/Chlorobi group bacterium MS-B_bin-24]